VKKWMPFFWLLLSMAMLADRSATPACAAEAPEKAEVVAVACVASVDQLTENLAYFTRASGRYDVGGSIHVRTKAFLDNLDRTKPAGILVTIADDEPRGIGFLPVPDLAKLLTNVRETFDVTVDELENGLCKLEVGKGTYLKQQGPWLFFSENARHLSDLPADPTALLDGLDRRYSVSFRLYVRHVPSNLRQLAIDKMQSDIDAQFVLDATGDPAIDGEFLKALRAQLKQFVARVVNESEQITAGWAVDSQRQHTYVDLEFKAVDGSQLARELDWLAGTQSSLTGFLVPEAAATVQGSVGLAQDDAGLPQAFSTFLRKKCMKGIDEDPRSPQALKDIVNAALDVFDQTVREGRVEGGAAVVLAPGTSAFVGGIRVADGESLAAAFQQLIELAKNEPGVPEVRFHAENHRGIDLHTFSVPIPDSGNEVRKVLGDELAFVVGTGPKNLFLAFGGGSDGLLKRVIDKSVDTGEQPVPPAQFRVAMKPLFKFLASIDQDDRKLSLIAEAMESAQGNDGISLTVTAVDGGFRCRLLVEEGVLQALGSASRADKQR